MTDVDFLDLLAQELGFALKSEQREALELLLRGKDVFCVLPTALLIRCLFMPREARALKTLTPRFPISLLILRNKTDCFAVYNIVGPLMSGVVASV